MMAVLADEMMKAGRKVSMHSADSTRKLAYLVSQYPKVTHSFIRREILALERQGWQIFRLSIRGWDLELADPEDILERERTTFVLREGPLSLAMAIVRQVFRSPVRFFSAAVLAFRMRRRSDRPFIWHLFYLAEACWIAPQLKKRGIAHVHAHFGENEGEVAMLVSELAGISYSMTVHGMSESDKSLVEKIRRAAFVVVISSFTRAKIFSMIGYHEWGKIKVVHCGIDASFAGVDAVVPSETNRLVCVGRLDRGKGQLFLVKTVMSLIKEGRKFELVLVGDGEHRGAIEQLIAENNLAAFVTVTGWASASRVKDEILRARALILPSFAEGLPVVLMEAMVLGRPVLSTYIAGIPELVVDGKTGWLFPAGSEQDMLDAIRACLDTPKEALKVMGELARTRALERHNVSREVEKLARLFESVLQDRRNARSAEK
jgi:colanic acid/amylovoran biosynthesis glycosyltransferase